MIVPAEITQPREEAILGQSAFKWMNLWNEWEVRKRMPWHAKKQLYPQLLTNQNNNPREVKSAADGSQNVTLAWEAITEWEIVFRYQRKVTNRKTSKIVFQKHTQFPASQLIRGMQVLAELLLQLIES